MNHDAEVYFVKYHLRWATQLRNEAEAIKPYWWNRRKIRRLKSLSLDITRIIDQFEAKIEARK